MIKVVVLLRRSASADASPSPQLVRSAGISAPHGSMAGRSGVNSRTRPAAPARIASILARSPEDS